MQQKQQQKQQQLQQQPQQLQGHFGNFFEKVWPHVARPHLAFSKRRSKRQSPIVLSIGAVIAISSLLVTTGAVDRSDRSRDRSIESIDSIDSIIFRSFEIFSNFRWRRCDSNGPKIIKIRAILAIFWSFEDFCDFRFDRFDIPFDSIDIVSEGRGGPPCCGSGRRRKN